jgi:hypothetical protein
MQSGITDEALGDPDHLLAELPQLLFDDSSCTASESAKTRAACGTGTT